ncbi:MAG: rod shape-determining protein [Chloroflexota bacterium]|nr:MAG: rod shape-determining protein [Chloroflexota bacterium]
MAVFSRDLGVDLGTMFTRIVVGNKLALQEPTVVAIAVDEQKIVSVGEEAQEMLGKVPESIEVARPMQNGVIADYEITEKFLEYVIRKVSGSSRFFRPKVMITVPYGVTSVESRAVHEAILQAGSREAYLIQQPLAAALGMDLPIGTPSGNMVLCLGAGTTQAAVLAMYGIVAADSIRFGGIQLDEAIITHIRKKYGLIIGSTTAEQVKFKLGTAIRQEEERSIEIQAQDQVSGLPRSLNITNDDVLEALKEPLKRLVETARKVLEKTPPELVSDIIDRGVAVCGGGAALPGIDRLMTKELGVPAYLVDNSLTCIAEGAATALDPNVYPKIKRNLPLV